MRRALCAVVVGVSMSWPGAVIGEEWSRFRGPNGSGVSTSRALPVEFGPAAGVDWSAEVPFGRSSPVLSNGRAFLTAVDDGKLTTLALDASNGDVIWRSSLTKAAEATLYHDNDSATPTPATDGSSVFVLFHELGVVAFDAASGQERWRQRLGPMRNFYGVSASPVLAQDRLVVVCDQAAGSFIVALDKATGETIWRRERAARREAYPTPVLYPSASSPQHVIVYGSLWLDAYDVETGDVVWSLDGVAAGPVASPVLNDGRLFLTGKDQAEEPMEEFGTVLGKHDADGDGCLSPDDVEGTWMGRHHSWLDVDDSGCIDQEDWGLVAGEMGTDGWGLFGIQLDGEGPSPRVLWNHRKNAGYIPSPLVVGGTLFMVRDSILSSLDPTTGQLHKRGRLHRGIEIRASPVAGDGKVYFSSTDGKIVVVRAAPQWEVLAVNDLGEEIQATPAITDGHLYVRTRGRLYSFSSD